MSIPFEIVTDPKAIRISQSGNVHGELFFRFGDGAFPSSRWDDFVVVVLAELALMARKITPNKQWSQVRFLEGPYIVAFCASSNKSWTVRFVQASLQTREVRRIDVEARAFVNHLIGVSESVMNVCEQRGWTSRDIELLASAIKGLRDRANELCG